MERKKLSPAFIPVLLLLISCQNRETTLDRETFSVRDDTIYLHTASEELMGNIRLVEAAEQSEPLEITTAGRIEAIPTQFAYVAPPFAGRVTKSRVHLGQKVTRNMPLFEIISPEYTAMQKEFFQAEAEKELARKDLARKEELLNSGVGSAKEYEEALNAMKQAEKEYESARASLRTFHIDTENMVFGEPLVIRAPITGSIIENNIVTGQYVSDDADPLVLVADLNKVWVSAQVKEKDIRLLNEGDEMDIHVDALPGEILTGRVAHMEGQVDEATRSIRVIAACGNEDERLKLGMYATMRFHGQAETYTVVPEKAVLQGEKESYVLVRLSPGCFVRRAVRVDFTKDEKAFIGEGLTKGEEVVGEGGYYFQ